MLLALTTHTHTVFFTGILSRKYFDTSIQNNFNVCFQEDNWLPMNFQNVTALQQFENSMINLGIKNIHKYTFGKCKYLATNYEIRQNIHN